MEAQRAPKVAAVQMATGTNVSANLAEAARHIAHAAAEAAALVVLPEFFALMGNSDEELLAISETPGRGPIQSFLANQARQHQVWIVGGTIPLIARSPGKLRAACLVFDDRGRPVARYDKIHLFDVTVEGDSKRVFQESRTMEAGDEVVVVDTPIGRLGLAVCYDLRFPELFRSLAQKGAEILAVPSAFTAVTGKVHWEVLLRARAIENLCYVVAPAQGGYHVNGRETHGDSMIVDPWGSVLARLTKGSGVVTHALDRDHIAALRRRFPALDHVKLKVEIS